MIHKIGLINFWYYDEEEFYFSDGRLLLRGSNGSGKSVTMQSFIPLLLDGNKSPERLDPFGSRARKLENYLLGEEETGEDERTGYLYMEFTKPQTGNYLTIGIGVRARRGKSLSFWGFAITDGRRIGRDFMLYKDMGGKVPLSRIELRNRIGEGGEFHDTQKDYMHMVNKLLFGFENLEDYDELVKLLVQLRTPKLSKDFKPTVIYDIMNSALQPLTDEDLRPMSEAIENMDNIKSQLEALKESKKAADKLKNEYDQYNCHMLFEKAQHVLNAKKQLDEATKEVDTQQRAMEEYRQAHQQAESNLEQLKNSREMLEHKRRELEQHDSFKAKQEIDKRENALQALNRRKQEKEINLDNKKNREKVLYANLKDMEGQYCRSKQDVEKLLEEMSDKADDFCFYEHAFAQAEIVKVIDKAYDFSYLKKELSRYGEKIVKGRKALEQEKVCSLNYDRAIQELDTAKNEKENASKELEKVQVLFEEAREEFVEKVYGWKNNNELLKIPEPSMVNITRFIRGYGETTGYDDIIGEVRKEVNAVEGDILKNIANLQAVQSVYQEELDAKQGELEEWKNKKDPEPQRENKVLLNRERLLQRGIPFVPLYKAVDFNAEVPEAVRGRLEEALIDMGLLDALIIPEQYRDKVMKLDKGAADKYIFPDPQYLSHELSQLLTPEQSDRHKITYDDIDNALKSIMLHEQGSLTYINERGEYGIGVLKGKVSDAYESRFIGVKAREKYRKQVITVLESEIEDIRTKIHEQAMKIKALHRQTDMIQQEFENFPRKDDLESVFALVNAAKVTFENMQKTAGRKEEAAEQIYRLLKQIREQVREITFKMDIPLNVQAYEQAREDMDEYKDGLRELETGHRMLVQLVSRIQGMKEQIEEILQDIDNLLYDLNGINREIRENTGIIENYRALLKQTDYEAIKKEIEACIEGLNRIPQKIEQEIKNSERCCQQYESISGKLEALKQQITAARRTYEIYRQGFGQEYRLGYVVPFEEEKDLNTAAKKVYGQLKGTQTESKTREEYVTALIEKHHESRYYLAEYNLIIEYIFDIDSEAGAPEEADEAARKILSRQKRLEIRAKIKGKDIDFYTLVEFIADAIEENEKLLRESDRQLFEDILANTISKKIRAKIYHAEQWVKKMNSLMEAMNTSSGLSFSLMWKSKVAETEEQLDTRKLVEILKSEASLLQEEDFQKLSAHFRSKIAQARKEIEDTGSTQTFHTIMKEILDYRQWFEFRLYFRKTGESKKELTNNAFDKFSGGEKAMAMYVPLFSAVYARYEAARRDCPRIISLDEAFAGVDENNIRDMFRLLEELKLNFIINSQILWGDYDTVPALSICELVRPNNDNVVTVIRYKWDGKVKSLIS